MMIPPTTSTHTRLTDYIPQKQGLRLFSIPTLSLEFKESHRLYSTKTRIKTPLFSAVKFAIITSQTIFHKNKD